MTDKNRQIYNILNDFHQNAECELKFSSPFELLVAVVLSAQCTDKRVNKVTEKLFEYANTPEAILALSDEELKRAIFSVGFYNSKAKALKELSASIVELGYIPKSQDELMTLRGVGRKTANVVYSVAYGGNAIAVDTHVFRVSNRIGLVKASTPAETEKQLMRAFDQNLWSHLHHLLIFHGRYVCKSQNPDCSNCPLSDRCRHLKDTKKVTNKG